MHNCIEVSIVFCQYNPIFEKIIRSLYSIIIQKNIKHEIIIVDDGSREDYFESIEKFFIANDFSNYKFFKNENNIGTVKNFLKGIELAQGEYIFLNSPGDILAYDNALCDYYRFAAHHKASCLFANAIYYEIRNSKCSVHSVDTAPKKPDAFKWYMPRCFGKYALVSGERILGSVFLRKKEYAYKYILSISHTAKYVEDYTSALYSVVEDEKIVFFNRIILWYEVGLTRSKEIEAWWNKAILKDVDQTVKLIREKYPEDRAYDFFDTNKSKITRVVKHPLLLFIHLVYKFLFESKRTVATKEKQLSIQQYLDYLSKIK